MQFDGELGEMAKDACAEFCKNQKLALEQLKVCTQQLVSLKTGPDGYVFNTVLCVVVGNFKAN